MKQQGGGASPSVPLKGLTRASRQIDSVIREINELQRGFQADQLYNVSVVMTPTGCSRADVVGKAPGKGVER